MDGFAIAKKWQEKWKEDKVFEPKVSKQKKFFCNFPIPYINAYQHIGHLYTLMRVDAFARYKRLKGFNVLFPQGWHITGSPIVNAAKRIQEKEPKQLKIMKDMGFTDKEIQKFETPEYWAEFFAPEFKKDYTLMGMSIDWSREFHTASLNPHFDRFVRWQMNKLKGKNLIIKGKFPVVWDPKDNCAVGDHDRVQGEGETPQEFMLTKHKLNDGRFVVTATLRPDTILGITNLYVHPKVTYKEIIFAKETWIVGEPCILKLKEQGKEFEIGNDVQGISLVGKETQECDGHNVPILPATFLDPVFGTGIVHSVPSDSADDLIALWDLQKDEATLKKFDLDLEKIQSIKPIAVLDTPEYGDVPAKVFLEKYNITSQQQRTKLEEIKKELYKLSFYSATYNKKYEKFFSKNLHGKKVEEGKDLIKKELIEMGWADTYYQLTGKVVTRSLTEATIKIVDDQWFINYADQEWKKQAHKCLENMQLSPEKARAQFDYTIDWLREWACTREEGLGTRLPWDEKWLIESLSDSTIYMAYYTIADKIKNIEPELLTDKFFDYIFLGKGKTPDITQAKEMQEAFNYWYPVDFRNSGKDLIQNHLTFFIFNHVAIFPKKHWPQGIGTNGWVTVDGQKMSKSLGNMISVRDMAAKFGADASRITILFGGEGMDDPNWDSTFAQSVNGKIKKIIADCTEFYNRDEGKQQLDEWFESQLHFCIKNTQEFMEQTLFRSAAQTIFFDLPKAFRQYYKRSSSKTNKKLVQEYVHAQAIMASCFTPHYMEELWEQIGKKEYISLASWPEYKENKINLSLHYAQEAFDSIKEDIITVLTFWKRDNLEKEPKRIQLFLADEWKYSLVKIIKQELENTSNPKLIIEKAMLNNKIKEQGNQVAKLIINLSNNRSKLPKYFFNLNEEEKNIASLCEELSKWFDCEVILEQADGEHPKSKQGMPGKPAIVVE